MKLHYARFCPDCYEVFSNKGTLRPENSCPSCANSQIKLRSDRIGAAAKRYYDPKVGRFVTKDPIGFDGGDFNLYAYTKNNPVNYVDPDGERISVFTRSLDMKVKSGGYVHCERMQLGVTCVCFHPLFDHI